MDQSHCRIQSMATTHAWLWLSVCAVRPSPLTVPGSGGPAAGTATAGPWCVRLWWGSGGVDRARTFPSEFTQNNFAEYGKSFLTPPPPDPSVFQTSHVDIWRAFFEGIFRFAMSPTLPIPLFPFSFHITPF